MPFGALPCLRSAFSGCPTISEQRSNLTCPRTSLVLAGSTIATIPSVYSCIIHVLKTGCRWCDCPPDYGPLTTVYNRFNRWSRRRFWIDLLEALATSGAVTKSTQVGSTYVKAQRSAHGGKGGRTGARYRSLAWRYD